MTKINNVISFGFYELESNEQKLITEFINHVAFYDYKLKENINDCIFQIEIKKSELLIYLGKEPNDNQLEIMIGILNYLISKYQFHGNYIFLGLTKIKVLYDN